MQASQLPTKFTIPWANGAGPAYIRPIPTASQIGIAQGAASFVDGFVPINFQPVGSGGIPPSGQDFNGIFNAITAWSRWQAAGGTVPFDQTFANAVGGYPYGAIVQSTTSGVLWFNTADGNTTNPDGNTASGWISAFGGNVSTTLNGLQVVGGRLFRNYTAGTYSFTVPAGVSLIRCCVWGGGGGGGGSGGTGAAGTGGAGGGYAEGIFSVSPQQVLSVVVGAGGGSGVTGGTSSISGLASSISATGGGGGGYSSGGLSTNTPNHGQGYGGIIQRTGRFGGQGISFGSVVAGGFGGASGYQGADAQFGLNAGIPGIAPGGGGGGATNGNAGGLGADGQVDIYY